MSLWFSCAIIVGPGICPLTVIRDLKHPSVWMNIVGGGLLENFLGDERISKLPLELKIALNPHNECEVLVKL